MERKKAKKAKKVTETPEESEDPFEEEFVEDEIPEEDDFTGDEEEPLEEEEIIPPVGAEERSEDILDVAADVPVQVVAVLGKKNITMKDVTSLKMGEVVELNRPANEVVDLVVGGKLIAKGELVEIEGKLGVKIVKLVR